MVFEKERFFDITAYRLGRFHKATNLAVYFFSFSNVYIDSAQGVMRKQFIEIAKSNKPNFCLLTHYHEDHAGNAALLQKTFKAKIVSHKKSVKYLSHSFKMLPYEKIIWGKLQPFEPDLCYNNGIFNTGKHKFTIIDTPGHSEDSVCILNEDKGWLFSGDLYITSKPRYLRKDENIYKILNSLKKISTLEFETLFCSHRGIIKDSPKKLIETKISYLEELIYKTKKLNNNGLSVKQIRNTLLGKEDATSFLTFFDFCKTNLIKSILNDSI